MSITREELLSFNQFVDDCLNNGGRELTMEDCVRKWRIRHRETEDLASIHRGLADLDAGRKQPLTEVDREIRQELGFTPAKSE